MADEARELANEIHCGYNLAKDLLMLAGSDYDLVCEASSSVWGVESMKAYIISARLRELEDMFEEE